MSGDASFWRNAAIIGILHLAALSALIRWNSAKQKATPPNILWMDGGAGLESAAATQVSHTSAPVPQIIPDLVEPPPASPPELQHEETARPDISDIEIATPKPRNLPTPAAKPSPKSTAKPTPRSTPKPKPKATPKNKLVAKASTTPARPTPAATAIDKQEPAPSEPSPAAPASPDVVAAIAAAAKTGAEPTTNISGAGTGGSGGRGVGAGGASQFGWYAHMLHDRFFSQWSQPTSVVRSGAKMSTLVKLRIEKDGRVSRFAILKPSGNVVVDESVAAVAKRVIQVEPLPSGMGESFYEVNINFELNSEQ
jgi:TonB family protein